MYTNCTNVCFLENETLLDCSGRVRVLGLAGRIGYAICAAAGDVPRTMLIARSDYVEL